MAAMPCAITGCNPMHHQDHNIHVTGFRFPKPEVWPRRHTFNALRPLGWIAFAMLALGILRLLGVHYP